jgi:hypothetical protein
MPVGCAVIQLGLYEEADAAKARLSRPYPLPVTRPPMLPEAQAPVLPEAQAPHVPSSAALTPKPVLEPVLKAPAHDKGERVSYVGVRRKGSVFVSRISCSNHTFVHLGCFDSAVAAAWAFDAARLLMGQAEFVRNFSDMPPTDMLTRMRKKCTCGALCGVCGLRCLACEPPPSAMLVCFWVRSA